MSKDRTITIAGKAYPVTLPDFAIRDDIALSWHEATTGNDVSKVRRVAAAAIGLCTTACATSGASYNGTGLVFYGAKVYNSLREQGASIASIIEAGGVVVSVCTDGLFAREAEVEARASFSDPSGGDSIA